MTWYYDKKLKKIVRRGDPKAKKKGGGGKWRWFLVALMLAGGVWAVLKINTLMRYQVKGIDVSHHNGAIDWRVVKASGYKFAFIKATEGTGMVDSKFERNYADAKAAGMNVGAYHFYLPNIKAKDQAEHFLRTVTIEPGDLPPVLDVEVRKGMPADKIAEGAKTWLETVEAATGVKPILYTMPSFAKSYLDKRVQKYPLWIASLKMFEPSVPPPWTDWLFWQHSHTGSVRGIKGKVDLNYFFGTEEELDLLVRD